MEYAMDGGGTLTLDALFANRDHAFALAQGTADSNGAPVMLMQRDGWYTVCEYPPDALEPSPYGQGWEDVALIDPSEVL